MRTTGWKWNMIQLHWPEQEPNEAKRISYRKVLLSHQFVNSNLIHLGWDAFECSSSSFVVSVSSAFEGGITKTFLQLEFAFTSQIVRKQNQGIFHPNLWGFVNKMLLSKPWLQYIWFDIRNGLKKFRENIFHLLFFFGFYWKAIFLAIGHSTELQAYQQNDSMDIYLSTKNLIKRRQNRERRHENSFTRGNEWEKHWLLLFSLPPTPQTRLRSDEENKYKNYFNLFRFSLSAHHLLSFSHTSLVVVFALRLFFNTGKGLHVQEALEKWVACVRRA